MGRVRARVFAERAVVGWHWAYEVHVDDVLRASGVRRHWRTALAAAMRTVCGLAAADDSATRSASS